MTRLTGPKKHHYLRHCRECGKPFKKGDRKVNLDLCGYHSNIKCKQGNHHNQTREYFRHQQLLVNAIMKELPAANFELQTQRNLN